MSINKEVDIHLAIEELGLTKPTNSYVLNVDTHSIEKWYDRNEDTKPTDDQINAAWETWKSKNGYSRPFAQQRRILNCMNAIRAQREYKRKMSIKW